MPDQSSSSSSWADRFFGPLYGELYRRHLLEPERTVREVEFASEILNLKDRRVLDLAAGFGRHARLLARRNDVVALDLNLEYLKVARSGLRGPAQRRMNPVRSDMRALPLASRCFDAVLFLFNSFGYFAGESAAAMPAQETAPAQPVWKLPEIFYQRQLVPDDFGLRRPAPPGEVEGGEKGAQDALPGNGMPPSDPNMVVLREIVRVLRPGGELLMEVPNPRPLLEAIRTNPRRHIITAQYEIQEEYIYDPQTRLLRNRTRFRLGRREEDGEYTLRLYDRTELVAALREAGLSVTKTYGDYDGSSYSAAGSDAIIVQAKRRSGKQL